MRGRVKVHPRPVGSPPEKELLCGARYSAVVRSASTHTAREETGARGARRSPSRADGLALREPQQRAPPRALGQGALRELDAALDAARQRHAVPTHDRPLLARRQPLGRGGVRRGIDASALQSELLIAKWLTLRRLQHADDADVRIARVVRNARTLIAAQRGEGIFGRSLGISKPVGVAARWRKLRMRARLEGVLLRAAGEGADASAIRAKVLRMIAKFADGGGEPKLMAAVTQKYGILAVPEWSALCARYPPVACATCAGGGSGPLPCEWPSLRQRGRPIEAEAHIAAAVVQTACRRRRAQAHIALHLARAAQRATDADDGTPVSFVRYGACVACRVVARWRALSEDLRAPHVATCNAGRIRSARRHARLLVEQRHGRGLLSHSLTPPDGIAARWRRARLKARLLAMYCERDAGAAPGAALLRKVDDLVAKYGDHEATLLERVRSKYALPFVPEWPAIRARWAGDANASAHDVVAAIVIQAHARAARARRRVAVLRSEPLD